MTLQQQAVTNLGFIPNGIAGEWDFTESGLEWGIRVFPSPFGHLHEIVCCYDFASVVITKDGYASPYVGAHHPSCDSITAIRWAIRIAAEYNRLLGETSG